MAYPTDLDSHYHPDLAKGLDFNLLNACLAEGVTWRPVTANKAQEDLFGDWVQSGDTYYSRRAGGGFADVLKLSQASMDRVLVATFFANKGLRDFALEEMERRKTATMDKMREAMGLTAK